MDCIRLSAVRQWSWLTQSIILHTWCSFSLSYSVQLKPEDLTIRENSTYKLGLASYWHSLPRRGQVLNKFVYGEAPPRGPTPYSFFTKKMTLSYIFYWLMVPVSHTLLWDLYPLQLLEMHCHKIGINHKSRTFSRRIRGTSGGCLTVQIFVAYPPPPPLGFRVEPPRIGHKREYPPPSSGHSRKSWHSRTKKVHAYI